MIIMRHTFPSDQYVQEATDKRQIVLHHTVSGNGIDGDIAWWRKTKERVATHYLIDREGVVHILFDEQYWAYHLGLKNSHFRGLPYKNLDKQSIGIEIDSWGAVVPEKGSYYTYRVENGVYVPNTACKPVHNVTDYGTKGFRGFRYFESYTQQQIQALEALVMGISKRHNIPVDYNDDMWDVSERALAGESGIWSHCSYRKDKSDAHPQPELIEMLKRLKNRVL